MKKFATMAISIALIGTMVAGGSLAYLSDTKSDVNVMTLGNVKIAQHEYERAVDDEGNYKMVTSDRYGEGYKLQEFTQAKPLYPATGAITGWGTIVPFDQISEGAAGTQKVFAGLNNVQDKFVLVENTGKSDAYVRTLIALEYGSNTKDIIGISTGDFWTWNGIGIIEVAENNYYLYEAVYKGSNSRHIGGVLPAGEYTYSSLNQIYLANEATNEDCENLDGNDNGTYDILVLSQAVQTAGFADAQTALDEAFGKVDAKNVAEWFGGMATNKGVTYSEAGTYEVNKMIAFTDETGDNVVANKEGVVVNITGGYYDAGSQRNNCAVWAYDGGTVNINDGTFIADGDEAPATSAKHLDLIYAGQGGTINIYGGTFSLRNNNGWLLNEKDNTATITVYGGSFLNWNPADNESEGANTSFLAEGYAVETEETSEGIWYHVVKIATAE